MRNKTAAFVEIAVGLFLMAGRAPGALTPIDNDDAFTPIDSCPVTISSPGRYELTADLTCDGISGIKIATSNVHFKLNGHKITAAQGDATYGIWVSSYPSSVVLDHITISGPGLITNDGANTFLFGVALGLVDHSRVSEITVMGSRQDGINGNMCDCHFLTVRSNVAGRNQGFGIALGIVDSVNISENDVSGNGGGIELVGGNGHTVHNNIANGNTSSGIFVSSNTGARVYDNATNGNGLYGIEIFGPGIEVFRNQSLANATYDLFDHSAGCAGNVWHDNVFFTANQSCIH